MTFPLDSAAATPAAILATQLRSLRLHRGWNMDRVAASAGISRTTLFHLERGEIRRPRASTLHKLAEALAVPIERLVTVHHPLACDATPRSCDATPCFCDATPPAPPCKGGEGEAQTADNAAARRAFDRATNPSVVWLAGERPDLFTGWLAEDWDELYSQFGVGGPLSEEGVLAATQRININRDAVYRLRVVMQTHLADVACALVETLYRQVCVSPGDETEAGDDVSPESCATAASTARPDAAAR